MTKLQYSGRGRGRGVVGRSHSRAGRENSHLPAADSRRRWVRAKEDVQAEITNEKPEAETPISSQHHRPILKGPPVAGNASNVWRRPKDQRENLQKEKELPEEDAKESISDTKSTPKAPILRGPKSIPLGSKTWKRGETVGKLEKIEENGSSEAKLHSTGNSGVKPATSTFVVKTDIAEGFAKELKVMDDTEINEGVEMESNDQNEPADLEQGKDHDDQHSASLKTATNLKKVAPNKLVLSDRVTKRSAASLPQLGKALQATRPPLDRGRGHRRPRPGASLPPAKRIKVSRADGGSESEGENDGGKVVEKLTDFAYRETSTAARRGRGRGRGGRGRGGRGRGGGSIGLVRVQPDESKTPICPSFLRGLPCTNERCFKRHDVPQEFATPVCSFFQRQGMCLKEDCPFRHIKVNPRAMVCPSFSLLGFCQDSECTMMHTRPRTNNRVAKKEDRIGAKKGG